LNNLYKTISLAGSILLLSACTQVITAPLHVVGAVAETAIDITGKVATTAVDVAGHAVNAATPTVVGKVVDKVVSPIPGL